jgi:hypothetical protein
VTNLYIGNLDMGKLTPKGEKAASELAQELLDLSRRTRPTSR